MKRGLALLLLLLLFSQAAWNYMVARCPDGWESRGGTDQCYLVHNYGRARTFSEARTYCQARDGDLVHIESVGIRDWLGQLVGATGDVGQNSYMWVGLKKVDGEWKWVDDNHPLDNLIIDWEDDSGSGDCGAFTVNQKLIKQDCQTDLKFMCHRKITKPLACDNGWEESSDKCYKVSDEKESWYDASVECKVLGAKLSSINGNKESQLSHDFAIIVHDKVWIGLTEEGHPGEFKWTDGSNSNFTNWAPDQPDLSQNGYGAVVVDNDDPDGHWVVERMTEEFHYMCRKVAGGCVAGWEEFEESCYYFNTENVDSVVWENAKETCEKVGAQLVVLDTPSEDVFFRNHIPETDTLWLGLYSIPGGDDFLWVDGKSMGSKNYTFMTDEDKNDALGSSVQKCTYFQLQDVKASSSWVPTDCTSARHYACEAKAGQSINLIPPSQERYCPEGWLKEGDYCYLFKGDEMSWTSAQKHCQRHYSSELVSVITWTEQDFVKNHMVAGGWIGLNDRGQDDKWVWSDGSGVTITNWNENEPSGGNENCVEMKLDTGKWNDLPCDSAMAFTCKVKASTSPLGGFSTTPTTPPDYTSCGYGWTENPETGECYYLELEELSFDDARLHCRELSYGGEQSVPDLLSIYSSQEQTFIYGKVAAEHLSQTTLWLGMKNDYDGNRWVDGTPTAFFNWNDGEPNSWGGEPCVEMYTDSGKWNDAYCNERRAFICEKKGSNYVGPQLPPPPDVNCPSGWSFFDNNCYYFSSEMANWDTAFAACSDLLGSSLTSITNIDENDFIAKKLGEGYTVAWLGLHDDNNGENWHWTDGTPFTWTNWGDGEPNNQFDEHCGEMRVNDYYYNGKWNDVVCSTVNSYVCKLPSKTCPQNWLYDNGKCYYASDYEATWHEAQDRCKEVSTEAELVSLHSDEENTLFKNQQTHTSQSTWLGLSYQPNISAWVWSDGQDLDYEHWNSGEPNNMDSELCGEMIDSNGGYDDGMWNNLACTEPRTFGCEFLPTHATGCEANWMSFENYCYYYSNWDYSYTTYSFKDAQSQCQAMGGDLASVHTPEENDFLFSWIDSYDNVGTWIGMTDDGHSGSLGWTDDTSITYTNFDLFYADPFASYPTCTSLYAYTYTAWGVDDCSYSSYFICKKPQEPMPINPPDTGCQGDDLAHKASCYSFIKGAQSWSSAKSDCESRNAYLVVLNDRYETAFVSAILGEEEGQSWIGLSGEIGTDSSVTFSWVNGDPVDFTNWDEFEPAPNHGTCVSASGDKSNPGLWSVRSCDDPLKYVCEYLRTGYTTPPPQTTRPPGSYCLGGWEHRDNRCYKVMKQLSRWNEGEVFCSSFGGHLVSIESANEENIIMGLPGMDDLGGFPKVWVGLKMGSGSDSGYEWSDGTAFSYVNWDVGEPDTNDGREICISADPATFKLSNSHCDSHLPFICEAREGTMVTTVAPPTRPPTHKCTDDESWYLYNDYCYKFVSVVDADPQSWWKSHDLCRNDGGELASIHTVEENYWIESMIYELSDVTLWIGGRAKIDSGYEWIDGTPFDFDSWAGGEPNNVQDQEDCISMDTHKEGYWNDMNCGNTQGRICKRPHGRTNPPSATTVPPPGHCPSGWVHTGAKCLQFNQLPMTFSDAREMCHMQGSGTELVSIHSPAEQAYLFSALGVVGDDMWLGLTFVDGFHWVDQTSVTYTNWAPGEPNGGSDGGDEKCVQAFANSGKWNDITCNNLYGFVCMMKQDPNEENHNPPPMCPAPFDNYVLYNGACYKPVSTYMDWETAEKHCVDDGAHLASILTAWEDSFIWVTALENHFPDVWTGLNDRRNIHVFKWTDGWPTLYTNWGPGQPLVNTTDTNCVAVGAGDGLWSTTPCEQTKPFICKYTNQTAVTADPPTYGHCPDSRWKDLGGSYCYLLSDQVKTWQDANMNCLHEDSSLVSIHSSEELFLIKGLTSSVSYAFWIGLVQKSNGYGWSDGTGFDFINWDSNEPNSEAEQCVEQMVDSGQWNDAYCTNARRFVCKTKKRQDEKTSPPVTIEPTHNPGGGGNKSGSTLGGGAIAGIVISVLFVLAGVGYVGFSYVQKQPKKVVQPESYSFDNILYNGDNPVSVRTGADCVTVDEVPDGSNA